MEQFRETGKMDDLLNKEIIDTFFKKSVPDVPKKKKARKQVVLFVSAALAVFGLVSIIAAFYIKSILPKAIDRPAAVYRPEYIMRNGRINYSKTERIYFDGDTRGKSALLGFSARLVNSGASGNASLTVVFKKPADLAGKLLFLSGKAVEGEKNITIILIDTEGRFLEFPGVRFFPDWASRYIYLNTKNNFDLGKVKEVKIEFGSRDTGNVRGSVIYIKDIIFSSREGA